MSSPGVIEGGGGASSDDPGPCRREAVPQASEGRKKRRWSSISAPGKGVWSAIPIQLRQSRGKNLSTASQEQQGGKGRRHLHHPDDMTRERKPT